VRIAIYTAFWLSAAGYAILRGGPAERIGAAILLWLSVGVFVTQPFLALGYHLDKGAFLIDLIGLAGFLYLGLKSDRTWTIWACSAQVIAVVGHIVSFVALNQAALAYGVMTRGPAYIQCLALLIGTRAYSKKAAKDANSIFWPT
jgi:hypothetical protein